jgi:hypothetical protein
MSDFDDAIGDMTTELLSEHGSSCVYRRGNVSSSVTLRMSTLQPVQIDSGGQVLEVRPVDFIGLTIQLPYTTPEPGDRITLGTGVYEVQTLLSEKVFRQISPQMTRIHTLRVN